ncbi:MAG TPA: hypothetical protein VGK32_04550 [Vicinamibacterales bacterium]|jgi:hypothetical protein
MIPGPDVVPLPAPPWLLSTLLMLLFVLHLVPMNLLLGGSIIAAVSRIRGRTNAHAAALADLIAHALPVIVAATVSLGVAALLFVQALYGRLFFTAAVLMAAAWLGLVVLLILAYYGTYVGAARRSAGLAWVIVVLVAAIGFIQSNVMSLMLRPPSLSAKFALSAAGLHWNLGDPTLAPRCLHMLIGSVAVSGAAVAAMGLVARRRDVLFANWLVHHGVLWCACGTVVNLLAGFWWLGALPSEILLRFMGRDLAGTIAMGVGILAALSALGHFIPAAYAGAPGSLVVGGVGSLAVSLASMAFVRDVVRRAMLQGAGFAITTSLAPQWGAIAVFALLLVTAAGTIVWMVKKLMTPARTTA